MLRSKILIALFLLPSVKTQAQVKAGDKAPAPHITNWVQNIPEDKSLAGKFLVIDFWATWCAPCLGAVPHMNELVEANKNNPKLRFLAISDEKESRIRTILPKVKFSSIVIADTTEQTFNDYGIRSIPFCVLVDDQMEVKWAGVAYDLTNDIIQKFVQREAIPPPAAPKTVVVSGERLLYDSLYKQYSKVYKDSSMQEYFDLGPATRVQRGLQMDFARPGAFYRMMVIGKPINDVISRLAGVGLNQVKLPSNLSGTYISLCYKSDTNIQPADLLQSIVTELGLRSKAKDTLMSTITLEVTDTTLLYAEPADPGNRTSHISSSDGNKIISLENHRFAELNMTLQNRFNAIIHIKNADQFNKRINMTVLCDDFSKFQESMRSYGVKATRSKLPQKIYYLDYPSSTLKLPDQR